MVPKDKKRVTLLAAVAFVALLIVLIVKLGSPSPNETTFQTIDTPSTSNLATHPSTSLDSDPQAPDLPPPPSALNDLEEAVANTTGSDAPRLEDANRLHQARTDEYIRMLDEEDMATSLRRLYMHSEIVSLMAAGDGRITVSMTYNDMMMAMKSRRYRKLYEQVVAEREQADPKTTIRLMADSVDQHLARLDQIREAVHAQITADPTLLNDHQRYRDEVHDRWIGPQAVLPITMPDGVLPVTLTGAELALQTTANLLGHSESAHALPSLLKIADYDATQIARTINDLRGVTYSDQAYRNTSRLGRPSDMAVLVDAMDRILVADKPLNQQQAQLKQDYLSWRTERQWPDRISVASYAYNTPQSPHEIQGKFFSPHLGGEFKQQIMIEAPLSPAYSKEFTNSNGEHVVQVQPGISTQDAEQIVEWARQYNALQP